MVHNAEEFMIYPVYFNSDVSLEKGRKYPLSVSISKPAYKEIKNALTILNIDFTEEPEKMHPRDMIEKGRFKIRKNISKKQLVKEVVEKIKDIRKQIESKSKGTSNFLNLMPRSKKNSKKK